MHRYGYGAAYTHHVIGHLVNINVTFITELKQINNINFAKDSLTVTCSVTVWYFAMD